MPARWIVGVILSFEFGDCYLVGCTLGVPLVVVLTEDGLWILMLFVFLCR